MNKFMGAAVVLVGGVASLFVGCSFTGSGVDSGEVTAQRGAEVAETLRGSGERLAGQGTEIQERARTIQTTPQTPLSVVGEAKQLEAVGAKVKEESQVVKLASVEVKQVSQLQGAKLASALKENEKLKADAESKGQTLIRWVLAGVLALSFAGVAGGLVLFLWAKEPLGGVLAVVGVLMACLAALFLQYLFWVCVGAAVVLVAGGAFLVWLWLRERKGLVEVVAGVQNQIKPLLSTEHKQEISKRLSEKYSKSTKKLVNKIKGVK